MDEPIFCKTCDNKRYIVPGTERCSDCCELDFAFAKLIITDPGKAAIWAQHAVYKAVAEIDVGDHTTEDEDIGDLRGKVAKEWRKE